MTDERYAAYLTYLSGDAPDIWRDTDGTLYLTWMLFDLVPPDVVVDPQVGIPPGDPHYNDFLGRLLPHFDYQGMEIPHAAGADADA